MGVGHKLSNLQLELLKLYSEDISDDDLLVFKSFISRHFAEKAIKEANKVWDEKKWDEAKVQEILESNFRKSSSVK
ncbi:MAG: hypothetical protein IPH28_06530 [Cytophagaceae bacterium]|jgi:hypothetical protein|nr:hypothetical protein [Cytophagaceae bacterium]MBL0324738.1 hypothetical protein [Cytophagaceae bacterium]